MNPSSIEETDVVAFVFSVYALELQPFCLAAVVRDELGLGCGLSSGSQ